MHRALLTPSVLRDRVAFRPDRIETALSTRPTVTQISSYHVFRFNMLQRPAFR
jgi:hypothetical protein